MEINSLSVTEIDADKFLGFVLVKHTVSYTYC